MLPNNRRHSSASYSPAQSTETPVKTSDEILFETLMNDPKKKAFLLNMLSQEKDNIERYKQQEGIVNKTPPKAQQRTYCESPTALLRRRVLTKNCNTGSSSAPHTPPTPSTPVNFGELLKGVVAYVEIRSKNTDRSAGAKMLMEAMGATVVDVLNRKVTHVVFKDGSFSTYQKAKLLKVHLVSVLWLEAVRKSSTRVLEKNYPALGTETYDVNVTAIYQDYENIVRDEQRRSLAVNSQRSVFHSQKRNRLTMLPSELRSLNQSCSSKESFYTVGKETDVVPSSQEFETESIISYKGAVSGERPNSATLDEQENIELTSDNDSECGIINGHSMSQIRDSLILDLDAQLSQQKEQNNKELKNDNRFSKSSSTPSESLLSRKSLTKTIDVAVDMDLTEIVGDVMNDERGSVDVHDNVFHHSNKSTTKKLRKSLGNCEKQLSCDVFTDVSKTCKTRSSDPLPNLRTSIDSIATQYDMPALRISTESELQLHNEINNGHSIEKKGKSELDNRCRTNSSSTLSNEVNNTDEMSSFRISTENEGALCQSSLLKTNIDIESSTKRRRTHSGIVRNCPSGSLNNKVNIISDHKLPNEVNKNLLNVKGQNTTLSRHSSNVFNTTVNRRTRSANASPFYLQEVNQSVLGHNNNNNFDSKLGSGTNKKLRKLFNLNQPIDATAESVNVMESQSPVNARMLIVPLPRMSFDNLKPSKTTKNVILFPIKKKKKAAAVKKLRSNIKSVKKVLAGTDHVEKITEKQNIVSLHSTRSSNQSENLTKKRNSITVKNKDFDNSKEMVHPDTQLLLNGNTAGSGNQSNNSPKQRVTESSKYAGICYETDSQNSTVSNIEKNQIEYCLHTVS